MLEILSRYPRGGCAMVGYALCGVFEKRLKHHATKEGSLFFPQHMLQFGIVSCQVPLLSHNAL